MTISDAPTPPTAVLAIDPESPLVLVEHVPDVLGEAHGFGGFLCDRNGRLVIEDGLTWLYTTKFAGGLWESWARRFDLATMEHGPARRVLQPNAGDDRAVLHHVVAVADDLIVGLYCDGLGFSAGVATAPDAAFVRDPGFALRPEIGWETRGESVEGWSLECNGAHVLCEDTPEALVFWQGYDSYRRDGRLGDLGWVRLRVDKATREVRALERHAGNPLAFRNSDWSCVRCGGNLSSDVRIAGKRAFFYYIRPNDSQFFIGMALCSDPMFLRDVRCHIVGAALEEEAVAEKFQAIQRDEELLLFYESRFEDGTWRTGLRRYRERRF